MTVIRCYPKIDMTLVTMEKCPFLLSALLHLSRTTGRASALNTKQGLGQFFSCVSGEGPKLGFALRLSM